MNAFANSNLCRMNRHSDWLPTINLDQFKSDHTVLYLQTNNNKKTNSHQAV